MENKNEKNFKKLNLYKITLIKLENSKIIGGKTAQTIRQDSCKTCIQLTCNDCPSRGCSINAVYCAAE